MPITITASRKNVCYEAVAQFEKRDGYLYSRQENLFNLRLVWTFFAFVQRPLIRYFILRSSTTRNLPGRSLFSGAASGRTHER